MKLAKPDAIFMHCLPVGRNEEVPKLIKINEKEISYENFIKLAQS